MLHRILTASHAAGEEVVGALDVYIIFGMFLAAVYASTGWPVARARLG